MHKFFEAQIYEQEEIQLHRLINVLSLLLFFA